MASTSVGRSTVSSRGSHPKSRKRVVIEDDEDDDEPPIARRPPPTQNTSYSEPSVREASRPLQNGSASSNTNDVRQRMGKTGERAMGSEKSPRSRQAIVDDDDEEDEFLLTSIPTKVTNKSTSSGSGSSRSVADKSRSNGGARNGVKKEPTFKIPKIEGTASRSASAGGSSPKVRPGSMSSVSGSRSGSGSRSNARQGEGGGRYDDGNDDFQPKHSKLKKRPIEDRDIDEMDFEDVDKAARRKRKLEEEREKAREAARKKNRWEQEDRGKGAAGSGVSSKVKAEPSRSKGSSNDNTKARARTPQRTESSSTTRPRAELTPPARKVKTMTRAEKIEQAMKVYKWWEEPPKGHGMQWESLEHNGAHFAPEYQPHGVKLKYDGKQVHLTPHQEEVATFYASVSSWATLHDAVQASMESSLPDTASFYITCAGSVFFFNGSDEWSFLL